MNTEEPRAIFKLGHHDWLLLQAACASVNALFTNRGTSKGQTVTVSFVFEGQFGIQEWNGLQKIWTSLICRAVRFTLPILVSKKWWWIASFIRRMVGTHCLPIKIQPSQRPGSGVDLFRVPFREGLCECWLRRWDRFIAYGRCTGYITVIYIWFCNCFIGYEGIFARLSLQHNTPIMLPNCRIAYPLRDGFPLENCGGSGHTAMFSWLKSTFSTGSHPNFCWLHRKIYRINSMLNWWTHGEWLNWWRWEFLAEELQFLSGQMPRFCNALRPRPGAGRRPVRLPPGSVRPG